MVAFLQVDLMEHSPGTSFEKERGVHAIQVRDDLALATCTSPDKWLILLKALADNGIPVFHLKLHDSGITFIVRSEYVDRVLEVSEAVPAVTTIESNVAFVSVVAGAMRDLSGIIARIFDALVGAGVQILQTGDAHDAVHCLVREASVSTAVAALQHEFELVGGGMA